MSPAIYSKIGIILLNKKQELSLHICMRQIVTIFIIVHFCYFQGPFYFIYSTSIAAHIVGPGPLYYIYSISISALSG